MKLTSELDSIICKGKSRSGKNMLMPRGCADN